MFEPEDNDEITEIYFDFDTSLTSNVGTIEYTEIIPTGFSTAMLGFINSFTAIMGINVALWSLSYYLIIAGIVISIIGLVFGVIYFIFRIIKRLENRKKGTKGD